MTKEEMIAALNAAKIEESVDNVKNADDTLANNDMKEVDGAKKADDMPTSELPTQKEIEGEVAAAEAPLVDADKDGVSKNGGEEDKLMAAGGVEAERKKQDAAMKDVINVSSRKMEESAEVENELLSQLQEAALREEGYKENIAEIKALCEQALSAQKDELTEKHANEMQKIFEAVVLEGEKLEAELIESAEKNRKMYETAHKLHTASSKLNSVLLEAVKEAKPAKNMTRYVTLGKRAIENACN